MEDYNCVKRCLSLLSCSLLLFLFSSHNPAASTDDDVDLEQLVNDMNSSVESMQSTQAETALLLNNSHMHTSHHHAAHLGHGQVHRRHTPPLRPSPPSREGLKHSQPMHIQAVR